jgi:hypothetical protein
MCVHDFCYDIGSDNARCWLCGEYELETYGASKRELDGVPADPLGELVLDGWLKWSKFEQLKLKLLAQNPQVFGVPADPLLWAKCNLLDITKKKRLHRSIDEVE